MRIVRRQVIRHAMAFLVWHGTEGYRTGVLCCNVLCDDCTVFQLTHRLHWQLGSRTYSSRAQSSSPHYSCSFQLLQQLQVRRQITHCDAKSDRVTTVYDMHWHTNLIPSVIYIYQLSNFASLHMPLPQPLHSNTPRYVDHITALVGLIVRSCERCQTWMGITHEQVKLWLQEWVWERCTAKQEKDIKPVVATTARKSYQWVRGHCLF